jgi:hypothetical protein
MGLLGTYSAVRSGRTPGADRNADAKVDELVLTSSDSLHDGFGHGVAAGGIVGCRPLRFALHCATSAVDQPGFCKGMLIPDVWRVVLSWIPALSVHAGAFASTCTLFRELVRRDLGEMKAIICPPMGAVRVTRFASSLEHLRLTGLARSLPSDYFAEVPCGGTCLVAAGVTQHVKCAAPCCAADAGVTAADLRV